MGEDYISVKYYIESTIDSSKAVNALADTQSMGLSRDLCVRVSKLCKQHSVKIQSIEHLPNQRSKNVHRCIAVLLFPIDNFGFKLPNLLSAVAGELFELRVFKNVKLVDISFPNSFLKNFTGPKFGIDGTRKVLNIHGRPLLGAVIKPSVGLKPNELAEICYKLSRMGIDVIKEDELYGPSTYSPLNERVSKVRDKLDKADAEKKGKTMYIVNVTDEYDRILENADVAQECGANCIMLSALTTGFSALRLLAKDPSVKVPIHVHRNMSAALTRSPRHGISTLVITKLLRLAGGDQIQIGSIRGDLYESKEDVQCCAQACIDPEGSLKPSLPAVGGGLNVINVATNLKALGKDTLFLSGQGIFGHKKGLESGAESMRHAICTCYERIHNYGKEDKFLA